MFFLGHGVVTQKLKEVSKSRWSGVIRAYKFLRYFWYIIRIVCSVLGGSEEQTNCLTATGLSDGASPVSLYATQSRVAPLWLMSLAPPASSNHSVSRQIWSSSCYTPAVHILRNIRYRPTKDSDPFDIRFILKLVDNNAALPMVIRQSHRESSESCNSIVWGFRVAARMSKSSAL